MDALNLRAMQAEVDAVRPRWPTLLSGAILSTLCLATLLTASCGEKVDCDKLDKSLSGCTEALMFRLRPDAKKSLAKATDPETKKANDALKAKDIERNRATLKELVVKQCRKHKGRAADAKIINECLEASGGKTDPASCQKFANCFGKFLKEKSK